MKKKICCDLGENLEEMLEKGEKLFSIAPYKRRSLLLRECATVFD